MKKTTITLLLLICFYTQAQSIKADELYKKGVEFYKKNEFQNAKNAFEQSFELNPSFNTLGMYLITPKDNGGEKIFPYIQKLKALNKIKSGFSYNVLNDMYLQMEKEKISKKGYVSEGNIMLNINNKIDIKIKEKPNDFLSNLNKGLSLISNIKLYKKNSNPDYFISLGGLSYDIKSIVYFDNLVKINPNSETGYFLRAFQISASQGIENIIKDFKTVLEINNNNAVAVTMLSWLHGTKYDYSQKMHYQEMLYKLEPNKVIESIKIDGSELEMLNLYLLLDFGSIKTAKSYKDVNDTNNIKILSTICVNLIMDKKYDDVIRICDKAMNSNIYNQLMPASLDYVEPSETAKENKDIIFKELLYYRGISNFNLKKHETALTDFNNMIQIDPKISDAYGMRGAVKISLNDFNGALIDLNKAIELDNSDGYMYFYRGLAQNKLEDTTSACLDLKKAIELGYKEASETLKEICK